MNEFSTTETLVAKLVVTGMTEKEALAAVDQIRAESYYHAAQMINVTTMLFGPDLKVENIVGALVLAGDNLSGRNADR